MAKYRLLAPAVIDGALLEAGREIEFDGIPGRHMEPLDADAKKREMPGPAPLDPLYLAYAQEKKIVGDIVMTGFYGFSSGAAPSVIDTPHVAGVGAVDETLTCTMGNWEGMSVEPHSYAYLWDSSGQDVGTDSSYVVSLADAGNSITCTVTATNAWGSTAAPPSNAVEVAAATRRTGADHGATRDHRGGR